MLKHLNSHMREFTYVSFLWYKFSYQLICVFIRTHFSCAVWMCVIRPCMFSFCQNRTFCFLVIMIFIPIITGNSLELLPELFYFQAFAIAYQVLLQRNIATCFWFYGLFFLLSFILSTTANKPLSLATNHRIHLPVSVFFTAFNALRSFTNACAICIVWCLLYPLCGHIWWHLFFYYGLFDIFNQLIIFAYFQYQFFCCSYIIVFLLTDIVTQLEILQIADNKEKHWYEKLIRNRSVQRSVRDNWNKKERQTM